MPRSTSDRFTLLAFGVVVGDGAAWFAWRLIRRGELMIGVGVSGLTGMGALAIWSAATGRSASLFGNSDCADQVRRRLIFLETPGVGFCDEIGEREIGLLRDRFFGGALQQPVPAPGGPSADESLYDFEMQPKMQSPSLDGLEKPVPTPAPAPVKPRLRGVSHRYAFMASLLPCFLLVAMAPSGRATLASAVYAGSLVGLLGTSAFYHGIHWEPRTRFWVARLDLLMIFVLIAGTYTPIAMLELEPRLASIVLAGVWGTALFGGILKVICEPPKWASAAIFVGVGSAAIPFLPHVVAAIGVPATALMLLGGALYVAGAIVYGLQRPDPIPAVFGYHEIFHAFVIAGAAVHFVAIAVYIIPGSPRA